MAIAFKSSSSIPPHPMSFMTNSLLPEPYSDSAATDCLMLHRYAEYAKGQKCMIVYAKGTVPK